METIHYLSRVECPNGQIGIVAGIDKELRFVKTKDSIIPFNVNKLKLANKEVSKEEAQFIFKMLIQYYEAHAANYGFDKSIINPILQFNKRTTALGVCKWHKVYGVLQDCRVYLSIYAMKDWNSVISTLAHELIHTMPNCQDHQYTFKRNMYYITSLSMIPIDTRADHEEAENCGINEVRREKRAKRLDSAKYSLVCPYCGELKKMMRKPTVEYICRRHRCVLEIKMI